MSTEIVKQENKLTASERFVNKVMEKFGAGDKTMELTKFQTRLAQSYFHGVDKALKMAESRRYAKTNDLEFSWENVKVDEDLANNIVSYARCGLDPSQKNHINIIPYKDTKANKYTMTFIEGYRGKELIAKKYGLDTPDAVIVELVYSTDKFKSIKKSVNNKYESYDFEITNDFDRGNIIGGFYYHSYANNPEKNKLVVMSLKDILKRRPKTAAPEFWGGEKDKWENGKKVGTEQVEGWYEKMCYKTIFRAAYDDIPKDPQKIDDDFYRLKANEVAFAEAEVEAEIAENANKQIIDTSTAIDIETGEIIEPVKASEPDWA